VGENGRAGLRGSRRRPSGKDLALPIINRVVQRGYSENNPNLKKGQRPIGVQTSERGKGGGAVNQKREEAGAKW